MSPNKFNKDKTKKKMTACIWYKILSAVFFKWRDNECCFFSNLYVLQIYHNEHVLNYSSEKQK